MFDLLPKKFIDAIDWVEQPGDYAIRYPMADREVQDGAQFDGA